MITGRRLLSGSCVLLLIGAMPLGQLGQAAQGTATLETESSLFYRVGARRILVKRLQPTQAFQGTAITRDGKVFLAYSGSGDEATTVLSVYDVTLQRERIFVELGATGETQFAYDSSSDLVAFDWEEGIYVFPLEVARSIPATRDRLSAFKKILTLVVKCQGCFEPRWAKDNRIAYVQAGTNGQETTEHIQVPAGVIQRR
jgi:hypothetical protein